MLSSASGAGTRARGKELCEYELVDDAGVWPVRPMEIGSCGYECDSGSGLGGQITHLDDGLAELVPSHSAVGRDGDQSVGSQFQHREASDIAGRTVGKGRLDAQLDRVRRFHRHVHGRRDCEPGHGRGRTRWPPGHYPIANRAIFEGIRIEPPATFMTQSTLAFCRIRL